MALRNLSLMSRRVADWNSWRGIGATIIYRSIKQIVQKETSNGLVIEGRILPSSRATQVVEVNHDKCQGCYMCNLNLDVKHTDVLILSQFVRSDGCMLPSRITGLCKRQQKRIGTMVTMAQKAGLMSNINPSSSKRNPRLRFKWKKWNSYWDETTIQC